AAMRTSGLRVLGPRGDVHLRPVQATDQPASIGPVDFVLFCVKLWDVESAGAAIRPLLGPSTAVIPLQNGIDASERLIPIFGKLRDAPEVFALFEKGVAEVAAVGRARGVHLPAELEARLLQSTRGFPPEMMPSMAVDLLRGNRLELPWLAGKVVALGRELGV